VNDAGASLPLLRARALELLHGMLRIRRFEEKCAELYGQMKIRGFLHLYIGEEAIAVGALRALGADDNVLTTYREHGHALARGISMNAIMAEMYGKASGCSGGRGGSMHLSSAAHRFYGGFAIVAGHLPLAVGLALADKLQNRRRVTACFFGEGAVAEGEFHESMNLAALWRLPVLFLCENNLYAMGTALARSESETDIHLKAQGYRLPSEVVDGMDVLAVEAAVSQAAQAVRENMSPRFLELRSYRFRAHSMFDPDRYRDKAEIGGWKKRGPLETFIPKLRAAGLVDDAELARMEKSVADEIAAAVAFAEASEWEPVETLLQDVHTPHPSPLPQGERQP
jgi:pyruvate dehydrogenase E1 component alpha subunit